MFHTIKSVEDVESHLDRLYEALKIYQFPISTALIATFAAADAMHWLVLSKKLPYMATAVGQSRIRAGVARLVPELYRRCPNAEEAELSELTWDAALQSLFFASTYDHIAMLFYSYHCGELTAVLENRSLAFSFPNPSDGPISSLNWYNELYDEEQQFEGISQQYPNMNCKDLISRAAIDAIRRSDFCGFAKALSPDLLIPMRQYVTKAIPESYLPENTRFGDYTLGQLRRAWIELITLSLIFGTGMGKILPDIYRGVSSPDSVIRVKHEELVDLLGEMTDLEASTLKSLVNSLTLIPDASRPDLLVRPLCPMPSSDYLVWSPFIIVTSNWLVCSLRNEAQSDPARYGGVIPPLKERLADDVALRFSSKGYLALARRKLTDPNTKSPIGDADVAIYDDATNTIHVLETKWLLEPDSPREGRAVDTELEKGRYQLSQVVQFYNQNAPSFLHQVFGPVKDFSGGQPSVKAIIVARGAIGGTSVSKKPYVVGYSQLLKQLQQPFGNIDDLWERALERQREPLAHFQPSESAQVTLGGFNIIAPGRSLAKSVELPGRPGRNAQCTCGSGIKYKKCCGW